MGDGGSGAANAGDSEMQVNNTAALARKPTKILSVLNGFTSFTAVAPLLLIRCRHHRSGSFFAIAGVLSIARHDRPSTVLPKKSSLPRKKLRKVAA
jgi:hypothetical protein